MKSKGRFKVSAWSNCFIIFIIILVESDAWLLASCVRNTSLDQGRIITKQELIIYFLSSKLLPLFQTIIYFDEFFVIHFVMYLDIPKKVKAMYSLERRE